MDPDRLPGILVCTGAIVGLAGSIGVMFYTPLVLLGPISFAIVLLLGAFAFGKRKEGRLLAGGILWFAVLGGAASLVPSLARGGYGVVPPDYYWKALIAVLGMVLSLAGAGIRLRRGQT
jgi:hypothetical protein